MTRIKTLWFYGQKNPVLSLACLSLVMSAGFAAESITATNKPPATTETQSAIDALVSDSLSGNISAIASLRIAALKLDDTKSMAILEQVRKSAAKRNSAVAACFIQHPEAWVQRTAINIIEKLGIDDKDTLNLLILSVEKAPPLVAQAAATALGNIRDPRSWSPLIDKLSLQNPPVIRLAHESLRQQTNQKFPAEYDVWNHWYQGRKTDEEAQFVRFQRLLTESTGNNITGIDGLASLVLLRDQATSVLITLADHPNQSVRDHVERYLRQWTGTLGNESIAVAVTRAQTRAIAPPPPQPVESIAASQIAMLNLPTSQPTNGFFDTTYGILLIVTLCCAALAVLLWFLRTPVGQVVQGATQSFTRKMGRSRVVVMFSNGTKRFVNSMPSPIKAVTKRFAAPAKIMVQKLADETKRTLKPSPKSK